MVESTESFGKYTLLEKVAVGGMAEIYRAKTQGIGGFEKLLAIKRLHPQFGEEHDVAQMLVDEARIAVHLTHPNIAQIFDLGCIRDQYFIAMEYIDGVDLHHVNKTARERGGDIPVPALVFCMAEALGGLHYAHTRTDADGKPLQIVHRDVSPQNIMISFEGEVKIVDFGIAKAESRAQEDTQHGIIKGKFYYMSPEQAHGHHIDARADIFAAGMVLYELLAGKNPYTRVDEFELLKAVRKADFPPVSTVRPDVAPELDEIVSRATQRNVNYRYKSARAMQMDLMAFLDRHYGPYRRMKLAEFVRGVGDRQTGQGVPGDEDSAVMSRDDFTASESSMIFEAGGVLSNDIARAEDGGDEPNPFADEEPTQLWTPEAPEPASVPDRSGRSGLDRPSPLGASNPSSTAGFDAPGVVPAPKPSTHDRRAPLHERLIPEKIEHFIPEKIERLIPEKFERFIPEKIERTHLIFGALTVLVVALGGVLTYLLMAGGEPADPVNDLAVNNLAANDLAANDQAADENANAAPARAASRATTVDVRITSIPSGAEVHLDGAQKGHTPTVLEDLSTTTSYDLMLSLPGAPTFERVIQPSRETDELEFELPSGGAVLKVATYPPNAKISVDGKSAGRSPVDVPGLERSTAHEVVATLDDGREVSRSVSWESDDGRVKQVELQFDTPGDSSAEEASANEPEPTPRRVKRTPKRRSRPKARKRTRRKKRSTTSSTKPAAELDLWGSGDSKKASTKKSESAQSLDIWGGGGDKAAKKGNLSVRIEGKGKIYVDDRLVADSTTSYTHSLEAGTYSVRVFFSRLKRYSSTKKIRVRSGKTSSVSFAP